MRYKVLLLLLLPLQCFAQNYRLSRVRPSRYEVTKRLDANPSREAEEFIAPYKAGVDSLRRPFVGLSEECMYARRPESTLSNWVADVMKWAGEQQGQKIDMGLCNIGGLRAAMPKDTVRVGDIMAIAPFENVLSIVQLKGRDLTRLFENIAFVGGEGVSREVRLVINTQTRTLLSATLDGKPIDPEATYTISTLNYLADGNDKMTALKSAVARKDYPVPTRDLLCQYFTYLNERGEKAKAVVEGRISGGLSPLPLPVREGSSYSPDKEQDIQSRTTSSQTHSAPSLTGRAGGESSTLLLVHTNDTHSCVEPLNPNLSDTAQADKGGYLRRMAFLRDLRQKNPDLLLFDCGDFSQGSTYYSLYKGDVEVGLMNLMRYDAATIGNHEFDFGLENMARIFRLAKFPIVCCNYDFTGTPCEGLVKPYIIINRAGARIGILGVGPKLEGLVSASTSKGVKYTDPIEAAQPVADYLRDVEHCDLIICLSHLGWKIDGTSDEELIPATRNIDIVLGGHSHTYFTRPEVLQNLDGQSVIDNQMGKNGRFIGLLRLTMTSR